MDGRKKFDINNYPHSHLLALFAFLFGLCLFCLSCNSHHLSCLLLNSRYREDPVRSRTDTTCVWLWDCNNKILSNSLRWWAGLDNIRFSFHEPQSSTRKGRWKRKIRCSNLLSNRSLVFSLWLGKIPPFVKLILGWKIPFFNSIHYIEKFSSSNHTHTHYIRKIKNFKKLNFDQDIVK